jgi:hypothetical protein
MTREELMKLLASNLRIPRPTEAKHMGHSIGRYVDGVVHTQTIGGFWFLIEACGGRLPGGQLQISATVRREIRIPLLNNPNIFGAANSAVLRRR